MNLSEKITQLESQLKNLSEDDNVTKSSLHVELANAYADLAETQNPQINLPCAIEYYKVALQYYAPNMILHARLQNSLGTAYQALAQVENHQANLALAIQAFEEAITFGNPIEETVDFMLALNNLGNACWQLAQYEDPARNLGRAQTAYQEARKFIKVEDSPLAYATLHNNLANVHQELAQIDETIVHLNSAITNYKIALEQLTTEDSGLARAGVQNNLGNAYRELAHQVDETAQVDENLAQALTAYANALEYYTPEIAPSNYLMTRANQGLTYAERYDWDTALTCWHEVAQVAERLGANQAAQQYRSWIEATESALAEDTEI